MDLGSRVIEALGLTPDPSEGTAQFETAGGVTVEAPIYRVAIELLGSRAVVRASPSEEQEEKGDEEEEDDDDGDMEEMDGDVAASNEEALLGHDALAALGLLVDCRAGRLLAEAPGQACV